MTFIFSTVGYILIFVYNIPLHKIKCNKYEKCLKFNCPMQYYATL